MADVALGGAGEGAAAGGGAGAGAGAGAGNANANPGAGTGGGAAAAAITFPDNWKDGLPEEFRKEASMESIKDIPSLAKSYIAAQKMVGKDKVVIPDPKFATADEMKAFFQKVGVPVDAKDYKIDAPKGAQIDPKFMDGFKTVAHQLNILPAQAQKLLEWYENTDKEMSEGLRQKSLNDINNSLNAYKAQQGKAYEKKVLYANKVITDLGGKEAAKFFGSNPAIGNNPMIIEMLGKIGEQMFSEDTFEGADRVSGSMTPAEATTAINEIMGQKEHAYWNKNHPKHQSAVQEVQRLFQLQNP